MKIQILSIYGRGFWLASELKKRNIKVEILDMTEAFSHWKPEDLKSPVGVFFDSNISTSQWNRMRLEDDFVPQKMGFCVWTPDGPLHFKSNLLEHYLSDSKNFTNIEELLTPQVEEEGKKNQWIKKLAPFEFDEEYKQIWMLKLSRQLAASSLEQFDTDLSKPYLKLQADYSPGDFDWQSYKNSLDWIADKGILLKNKKSLNFNELDLENDVITFLTAEELKFSGIKNDGISSLYSLKSTEPDWVWTRARYKITSKLSSDILPQSFSIIDSLEVPLTHSNLLMVYKAKEENIWDFYYRVPHWYEEDLSLVQMLESDIKNIIEKKIPTSQSQLIESSTVGMKSVKRGPMPYCLYSDSKIKKFKKPKIKNFTNLSHEVWPTLDWSGRMEVQKVHLDSVVDAFLKPGRKNDKTIFKR